MKAIILLTRRDGDSPEDFRRWWLEEHAPLARQLPGLRKLVFNLVGGDAPHDGGAELWFDSVEEFEAAYASEIGQRVAADSIAHLSERVRLVVTEHPQVG
ncbi:MAG: EthD family reductase [Thermoleophilia bacterium]|nr:EthD family reductase [Thermoleophilia bacterium]